MKNIFTKLGSKKVMGAVLVMVTLAVGIGVIGNFSGNDKKTANEAALSKFGENSYNNFPGGGMNRSDLERQISGGQEGNTARFLRMQANGTEEDDSYDAEGMTNEGFVYDENFNYGQAGAAGMQGAQGMQGGAQGLQGGAQGDGAIPGVVVGGKGVSGAGAEGSSSPSNMTVNSGVRGSYDKANPMYAKGGVDANGVPYGAKGAGANGGVDANGVAGAAGRSGKGSGSAAGAGVNGVAAGANGGAASQDAAAKAAEAAAKAEKAKQEKEQRNRIRRETQINKLASSGGGSSSFGSSGGGAKGGSSAGTVGGDNASRALPANNSAPQTTTANADGFKLGRGGVMGGYSVANGSGATVNNRKDGSGDRSAINSMLYASNASKKATHLSSTGAKDAARDAFEQNGGNDTGTLIEDGASIERAVSQLYDSASHNDPPSASPIDMSAKIQKQQQELDELQDKITNKYALLIIGSLIIGLLLQWLVKLFYNSGNWWIGAAAIAVTLGGFAFVHGLIHGFGNGMFGEAGDDSILGMINQMGDEEKFGLVNDQIVDDLGGKRSKAWWTYGGLLFGFALCWLGPKISEFFKKTFGGSGSGTGGNLVEATLQEQEAAGVANPAVGRNTTFLEPNSNPLGHLGQ